MEDLKLQQRVIDELEFTPEVNAAHIGVSVREGVVTLSGHVESMSEKLAAENAVRRVHGVRAVAQDLRVELPGDKKTADDEIAARALRLLDWDAALPRNAFEVSVSNGVVTLGGQVDWNFQRREAEVDMRKLGGVRDVINRVRLRPAPRAEEVSSRIHAAFKRAAELQASDIQVEARDNGAVVLSGHVRTLGEQARAENAAWAVAGVTSVENHIKVEAVPPA